MKRDRKKFLKIGSGSDFHVGHPHVSGEVMHANFVRHIFPKIPGLDIFFVGGDFFDALLNMDGKAGFYAMMIITELRRICLTNRCYLRILRGTFTHDYNQNQFFITDKVEELIDGVPAVRLFDNISIEYIEPLDINILYVPDDLPYQDAMPVIEKTVRDHNLDKVDISITHSYYEHLIPPNIPHIPHNTYSVAKFEKITSGVILNGHIHTSAIKGRVITHGSFERLRHGEEEDKGFYLVDMHRKEEGWDFTYEFVINDTTATFTTIDIVGYPEETGFHIFVNRLRETIASYKGELDTIFIRAFVPDGGIGNAIQSFVDTNFTNVKLTLKKLKHNHHDETPPDLVKGLPELPTITPQNLPAMLIDHIAKEKGLSFSEAYITNMLTPS